MQVVLDEVSTYETEIARASHVCAEVVVDGFRQVDFDTANVQGRLNANDPYFIDVSNAWSKELEDILLRLPGLTLSE